MVGRPYRSSSRYVVCESADVPHAARLDLIFLSVICHYRMQQPDTLWLAKVDISRELAAVTRCSRRSCLQRLLKWEAFSP